MGEEEATPVSMMASGSYMKGKRQNLREKVMADRELVDHAVKPHIRTIAITAVDEKIPPFVR